MRWVPMRATLAVSLAPGLHVVQEGGGCGLHVVHGGGGGGGVATALISEPEVV